MHAHAVMCAAARKMCLMKTHTLQIFLLTGHDDFAGEMDVPFTDAVPGYARVVAEVPFQDVAYPQLCAIVEDADPVGDLDRFVFLVPKDLGSRSSTGLNSSECLFATCRFHNFKCFHFSTTYVPDN